MLQKLELTPNVPVQIALQFADGKLDQNGRYGDQMYYTLAEPKGGCMYLNLNDAARLIELEPRAKEPIMACRRWTGKKGDPRLIEFWRPDAGSTVRTASQATGIDPTELEQQLAASLEKVNQARATASASTASAAAPVVTAFNNGPLPTTTGNGSKPNGNGTNGTPKPYVQAGVPAPMTKIPMNIAFNEVIGWMKAGLEAHHMQWSDAAQQDLVSTAVIGGMREGWIGPWERGGK